MTAEGTLNFETRVVDKAGNASPWRTETIKVDHTAPTNTTAAPSSTWRNSDYTRTVTGVDAHSGVQRVEYQVDGGTTQTSGNVTISGEGVHTLASRLVDNAGNISDWRTDTIGIDQTVPALAVDCGTTAWRNTQPTCSVAATGGLSGLAGVTGEGTARRRRDLRRAARRAPPRSTSAPSTAPATSRPPRPTSRSTPRCPRRRSSASRTPGPPTSARLRPATRCPAWPAWPGRSTVRRRPRSPNGGTFTVDKGSVTVYATDVAGNGAASAPAALADRSAPATPPTPRVKSEAVLLRKGGAAAARLVGQLALSSLPKSTTVDLRPLAIGKGTFQFVFKIKSGSKTKTVTKTQTVKTGYSTRISIVLPASSKTSVSLTVKRKSGKRWAAYATSSAKL